MLSISSGINASVILRQQILVLARGSAPFVRMLTGVVAEPIRSETRTTRPTVTFTSVHREIGPA